MSVAPAVGTRAWRESVFRRRREIEACHRREFGRAFDARCSDRTIPPEILKRLDDIALRIAGHLDAQGFSAENDCEGLRPGDSVTIEIDLTRDLLPGELWLDYESSDRHRAENVYFSLHSVSAKRSSACQPTARYEFADELPPQSH